MHLSSRVKGAVLLLLLVMMTEVALSTRQESPSWDEGDHIFSGYMNWKTGEYSLNPEHPPLVKLVATLPLLPLDLKIPPRQGRYWLLAPAFLNCRQCVRAVLLQVKVKISGSDWSTSAKNLRADPFAFVFALRRSAFTNACVSD